MLGDEVEEKRRLDEPVVLTIGLYALKRFDGVVGYRICLTHRRPPVRARVEPFFFSGLLTGTLVVSHQPSTMFPWLLLGGLLAFATLPHCAASLGERAFPVLSSSALADLANMQDPSRNLDSSDPYSHLHKILIPRTRTHIIPLVSCKLIDWLAADTENHTLVRNYLVSTLRKLNWHIEEDTFVDTTPYGPKNFTNVIATKDPDAPRRVVLAAHFDSKFFPSYPENQARPITFFCCRPPSLCQLSPPYLRLVVCRSDRLCRVVRHHA